MVTEPTPVGAGVAAYFAAALNVNTRSIDLLGAGHSAISDPPATAGGSITRWCASVSST
ncbi:MAG TPA: hypothetical protein VJT08_01990 [Terriglobales bacterium]|nr:hypothetical protein [Terriglobales bacterium]